MKFCIFDALCFFIFLNSFTIGIMPENVISFWQIVNLALYISYYNTLDLLLVKNYKPVRDIYRIYQIIFLLFLLHIHSSNSTVSILIESLLLVLFSFNMIFCEMWACPLFQCLLHSHILSLVLATFQIFFVINIVVNTCFVSVPWLIYGQFHQPRFRFPSEWK